MVLGKSSREISFLRTRIINEAFRRARNRLVFIFLSFSQTQIQNDDDEPIERRTGHVRVLCVFTAFTNETVKIFRMM